MEWIKESIPVVEYVLRCADTMRHDTHNARHDTDTNGDRRVSIREAADLLGITSDAVRARLRRGTLRKETGPKGETIVVLDADTMRSDADTTPTDEPTADYVSAVEKQVEILRIELETRNRELAEMRRLLAGALERIPALEPPPPDTAAERPGAPETASEEEGIAHPHPRAAGAFTAPLVAV